MDSFSSKNQSIYISVIWSSFFRCDLSNLIFYSLDFCLSLGVGYSFVWVRIEVIFPSTVDLSSSNYFQSFLSSKFNRLISCSIIYVSYSTLSIILAFNCLVLALALSMLSCFLAFRHFDLPSKIFFDIQLIYVLSLFSTYFFFFDSSRRSMSFCLTFYCLVLGSIESYWWLSLYLRDFGCLVGELDTVQWQDLEFFVWNFGDSESFADSIVAKFYGRQFASCSIIAYSSAFSSSYAFIILLLEIGGTYSSTEIGKNRY